LIQIYFFYITNYTKRSSAQLIDTKLSSAKLMARRNTKVIT